jgi:prepilin-type N-terminal cleavage/methylation domain-containing protein
MPMNKKNYLKGGFTLIELIIVIAVLAFVTGVMALMFNMVTKVSGSTMSQNIVLSQVQQSGSWISRDIMSAENVTVYDSGTRLCQIVRYMWNGVDSFEMATIDYDIIDNKLTRAIEPGLGEIIAQFISSHGAGTDLTASTSLSENNTYILDVESVYKDSNFSRVYKINKRLP